MKKLIPMLLLIVGLGLTVHAQSLSSSESLPSQIAPPTSVKSAPNQGQDDPIAKALEKAVDRAILAETKNVLYLDQLAAKQDRVDYLLLQIETLKEQKAAAKGASADRKEAGNIDVERLADAKTLIAQQQAEINRLRHPGLFASILDTRFLTGSVAGYALCKATTSGGTTINPFGNSFRSTEPFALQFDQQERSRLARQMLKVKN